MSLSFRRSRLESHSSIPTLLVATGLLLLPQVSHLTAAEAIQNGGGQGTSIQSVQQNGLGQAEAASDGGSVQTAPSRVQTSQDPAPPLPGGAQLGGGKSVQGASVQSLPTQNGLGRAEAASDGGSAQTTPRVQTSRDTAQPLPSATQTGGNALGPMMQQLIKNAEQDRTQNASQAQQLQAKEQKVNEQNSAIDAAKQEAAARYNGQMNAANTGMIMGIVTGAQATASAASGAVAPQGPAQGPQGQLGTLAGAIAEINNLATQRDARSKQIGDLTSQIQNSRKAYTDAIRAQLSNLTSQRAQLEKQIVDQLSMVQKAKSDEGQSAQERLNAATRRLQDEAQGAQQAAGSKSNAAKGSPPPVPQITEANAQVAAAAADLQRAKSVEGAAVQAQIGVLAAQRGALDQQLADLRSQAQKAKGSASSSLQDQISAIASKRDQVAQAIGAQTSDLQKIKAAEQGAAQQRLTQVTNVADAMQKQIATQSGKGNRPAAAQGSDINAVAQVILQNARDQVADLKSQMAKMQADQQKLADLQKKGLGSPQRGTPQTPSISGAVSALASLDQAVQKLGAEAQGNAKVKTQVDAVASKGGNAQVNAAGAASNGTVAQPSAKEAATQAGAASGRGKSGDKMKDASVQPSAPGEKFKDVGPKASSTKGIGDKATAAIGKLKDAGAQQNSMKGASAKADPRADETKSRKFDRVRSQQQQQQIGAATACPNPPCTPRSQNFGGMPAQKGWSAGSGGAATNSAMERLSPTISTAPKANITANKTKSLMDTRSDMSQQTNMRLQQALDRRSQQMDTLSNMTKKQFETQNSMTRNIK